MADAQALGACAARRQGSNPCFPTSIRAKFFLRQAADSGELRGKDELTYYDPSLWIDNKDSLITSIEDRIEFPKVVKSEGNKSKSFLPPNALELVISVIGTKDILFLRERLDKVGKVSIVLSTDDNVVLRQGHFNHDWHHNPNGVEVSPPHHIHFPTENYPDLSRPHTYAYPVKCDGDYISALYKYCDDCNIKVHGIPIPLLKK